MTLYMMLSKIKRLILCMETFIKGLFFDGEAFIQGEEAMKRMIVHLP